MAFSKADPAMPRLKNYTRSMMSSTAALGAAVLYNLAAVPLALHYLSKAEFGLWALSLQIAGYITLVDLGMGSSVTRILIDHKDNRASGHYGGVIQSGFWVGAVQAAIILAVGFALVWFLGTWLKVQPDLARPFFWLMVGQVLLTAATFITRLFNQLLYGWQRIDVMNYSGMSQLVVGFAALWLAFHVGWGIFSLLAGAAAAWAWGVGFNLIACYRFGLIPKAGEWGHPTRARFHELFSFGAEVFVITAGVQLITASQTVLVSRQLGLEAAALWVVMTKAFILVISVVYKIAGNAMPAFSEMHARGDLERFWHRYQGLFLAANALAVFCGVMFAACNGPFVNLWTHGRFAWPAINNVLLGAWMVMAIQQSAHSQIVITLKQIGPLKYIFLAEGIVFVGAALIILPSTGLTGMLVCSLAATILFTWAGGVWRIAQLSGLGWKPLVWDWQKPALRMLAVLATCGLALGWFLHGAPDWLQLVVNGSVLTIVGLWAALRFALPASLVTEIAQKLPSAMQRPVFFVMAHIGR
jgi:O-antigen/teichoic acid export membrane protein